MATVNLPHSILLERYLNTTYRPDVDYVDGELGNRNVGEVDHGDLQFHVANLLRNRQHNWSLRVFGEVRIRVSASRYRIPDVIVMPPDFPRERIIRTPPLLCIEVLSPRDTLETMRARVQDFLDMGVPTIWILDPETRTAHTVTDFAMTEQTAGNLPAASTPIELSLAEVFATLDQ